MTIVFEAKGMARAVAKCRRQPKVRRRLGRGAACVPGPVSKAQDTWFLINYAIAGISGWPYDLERYGNESDMWVDWVRVYGAAP